MTGFGYHEPGTTRFPEVGAATRGGTRTRVRCPVDNGTVPSASGDGVGPKGPGSFRVPGPLGAPVGWDRSSTQETAREAARPQRGRRGRRSRCRAVFEPYHWVACCRSRSPALTLLAAAAPRLRSGFWLGLVFGTAFMLVLLPWLRVIGVYAWIPLSSSRGSSTGSPAWPPGPSAGCPAGRCGPRGWVLVEALRGVVPFGGFPWGRLAFATEDTPLAPAFAYVGAAGVTFLVALVGTTLAWAVLRARRSAGARGWSARGRGLGLLASVAPFHPGGPPTAGGKGATVSSPPSRATCPGRGWTVRRASGGARQPRGRDPQAGRRVEAGDAQRPTW